MRILLDENVPVDLLAVLNAAGHATQSINFLGWKGMQNGAILERASADFDLFLTRDKDFDTERLGQYVTANFGVVLLTLKQQAGRHYANEFARFWPSDASVFVGKISRLGPEF